ncbi:TPA: RIP metalloprotease [Streptococcus suis]|uniref:Pheromone-processing membrane metalloprotease n=2 Tax=Streptococcus suis TaxID=1307 RepID=A0A0H3MY32_STRS4|nr:M50 family metallopeptidase [Streptococcus suis]ABP90928.1 Predicted membrane-associated Zn-dependent proteases 1 [Streptococcus suis 05ZYH33]ABP93125.1 Predicted membrane-associated Zn-dependent proteases 1 [Streptococcus suis 98HAH33]ADV70971.1 membrane-associated Zn-dependent proteases 1 [Streptococcus suis JS14]AER16073.1 membrane-associated Zn-dependent proteases 1 [Streptococcus suis SS12]AER45099.1 membrane-associated Zn-dependent proteases 1 [Streptococcus suis A7]
MKGILAFIFIFGVIVVVHEFGHFYFAKKAGILVREFAIGMGPKIFAHTGKDGTLYTIRILPLGGYVRMAGWGEDKTEIKTGSPASLSLNEAGVVTRINLSGKQLDSLSLPMNVTSFDFEEKLEITGLVLEESKTYKVDHDATIVEEDGTEVRIAPLDVQYQNATVWGRLMTNFAGPMNNFILGILVFILLFFMQGGVANPSSNAVSITEGGALQAAGVVTGDKILSVNGNTTDSYTEVATIISKAATDATTAPSFDLVVEHDGKNRHVSVTAEQVDGAYRIGISPILKTGFVDKIVGGFQEAGATALRVVTALKNLIANFDVKQLGGPVAIYKVSSQAAEFGLVSVLGLMAALSINLGIFNLIPIPALDGGKIVMNILEAIRRKPLKPETESYITLAGVAVMVVLMIVVTWNDIIRVFF